MTQFIGKSTHPVQVKKIKVRVWALRDEIEEAISQRMSVEGHSEENPVDIADIKEFYLKYLDPDDDDDDDDDEENDSILDNKKEEKTTTESEDKAEDSEDKAEDSEEATDKTDDDAKEETDAAKLTDQILEQGEGEEKTNQAETTAPVNKARTAFERVTPDESKIAFGYVLLADVYMDQIMVFVNKNFTIGQNIVIEFLATKTFSVTAELVVSQDTGRNSKIIRENNYNYRLQSLFLFQFPFERMKLREFLQSVEPNIPAPPKKFKRSDDDDDDDDFDDLGF